MEAGDFELTGETIILDENWNLLNGQHRLNACILAKKPFVALMVQGVPRKVYQKLDSGEKRRAADWLSSGSYNETNAKTLAGALKVLWTRDQGDICGSKVAPSNDEIARTLDSYPEVRRFNSSTFAKSVKGMPGSLVMALRCLFGQYDDKQATEFFEKLATGEGLKRDSPILLLRNKFATKEKGRSQRVAAAVVVKGWNAFVEGRPVTPHDLRFRTGKSGEEFPKIAGVDFEVGRKSIETDFNKSVRQEFSSDKERLSEVSL